MNRPAVVVLSSLFPGAAQPFAGIFIRERMFRVARELPLCVVSPQAWFPGQGAIRAFRPGYRPPEPLFEEQEGVEVHRPRAWCPPGLGRRWDSVAMARAALPLLRRLRAQGRCDLIDAHFAWPDGHAAAQLGRALGVPYTITLRGTEPRHLAEPALRPRVIEALRGAARVFAVCAALGELGLAAGVPESRVTVVANGVDCTTFKPLPRAIAKIRLGLPPDARVLCSVGGLVPRKGFHRVIRLLPRLLARFPTLHYLIAGGTGPEGDWRARLADEAQSHGVATRVCFLGPLPPRELRLPLSAADALVLPSSNEGWANVLLEAMACGTPVVASDVGGTREVVASPALGYVFPVADDDALYDRLAAALARQWDRAALVRHARSQSWDGRIIQLVAALRGSATADA